MKMIDIVIPAYKAHDTIHQTLCSIAYQTIRDLFHVTIVNDDPNDSYQKEIDLFSHYIDIQQITLEKNSGPGVARQVGIDSTSCPYLVFIDSDDIFVNPCSIEILYKRIRRGKHDVVVGNFVSEHGMNFAPHLHDTIWMHGKIYLRKYLEDHSIRFSPSRSNEDTGFNHLVLMHKPNIYFIENHVYVWCYRENSITRNNNSEYDITQLPGYLFSMTYAFKDGIQYHGDMKYIRNLVFWSLYMCYLSELEHNGKPLYESIQNDIYKEGRELAEYYFKNPYTEQEIGKASKERLANFKKEHPEAKIFETFDEYLQKMVTLKEAK